MIDSDPYDLNRFIKAQDSVYQQVLTELKNGNKTSHWMWFIFPQLQGLGKSSTAIFYSITSLNEAEEYLDHPILGSRLKECSQILLDIEETSADSIFGFPDNKKLQSSMTLFNLISDSSPIFEEVLNKFFDGEQDSQTLQLLDDNY